MQIIDRLPLGEMGQKIADLLARDLLGQAVWIDEFLAEGRVAIRQIAKIFTMDQRPAFNKNVLIGQTQALAGAHGQIQPGGIVGQHNGRFGGQRFGHFASKLSDHRAVEIPDVRIVLIKQHRGQPNRRHPKQSRHHPVDDAQNPRGLAPAIAHILPKHQQNVAAEIPHAQRRQIVKTQEARRSRDDAHAHIPRAGA